MDPYSTDPAAGGSEDAALQEDITSDGKDIDCESLLRYQRIPSMRSLLI